MIRANFVGWAKAPTGPAEGRPDDRLRAVPTLTYTTTGKNGGHASLCPPYKGKPDDDITRNPTEEPSGRNARCLELRARQRRAAAARRRAGPGAQSMDEGRSL